ncbi:uncharacterized protein LOC143181511 [Calliopsis andreniformis]|uniref:uncharacterized protein LOC143181511 n=1 Tax=Calliopsis andreniformis TaxID=337506 RepID=UPI003FCEBC19
MINHVCPRDSISADTRGMRRLGTHGPNLRPRTRGSAANFCPKCLTKFDNLRELRAHMIRACGLQCRKICPYCHIVAVDAEEVHQHIREAHPNERTAVLEVYNS